MQAVGIFSALMVCSCVVLLGQDRPPEPWRVAGVCPFECCHLGEWRARGPGVARISPDRSAKAAFRFARGDSVTAQSGEVRSAHLGRVVVRVPFTDENVPDTTFRPSVGDTVYITSYRGEGNWDVWYRGNSHSIGMFWPDHVGRQLDSAPGQLIFPPNGIWWVRVVNRQGQVGWIEGGHIVVNGFLWANPSFEGADSCG